MRRTHYLRNAIAGLFVLLLVVGLELFAHSSAQSGCATVQTQQVNCISTDGTTCKYSITLNVTNNTGFTGPATISGAVNLTFNLQPGSNIVTATASVPCGTPT